MKRTLLSFLSIAIFVPSQVSARNNMGWRSLGFVQAPRCNLNRFTTTCARAETKACVNPLEPTIPIVKSMPPPLPPLNNYYYLLRHGQSTANVEGIISSSRSLSGSTKHGLTLLGVQQGKDSASSLIDLIEQDIKYGELTSTKSVYFYSSPFARAKETAYACLQAIVAKNEVIDKVHELGLDVKTDVALEEGLMERYVSIMTLSTF